MFALMLSLLFACSGAKPETPPPVPAPAPEPAPAQQTREPGALPFDFPRLGTTAKAGDFVLAPSRDAVDNAFASPDSALCIYYGATMVEPGEYESKIKTLAGTESTIPNALIVAIPRGQTAAVGDVLLGHWQSGSGLQRGLMVSGDPKTPNVRLLDTDWDNPAGIAQKDDAWQADRFVKLARGQIGTTVACKRDDAVDHGVLVALSADRLLSLGFAGKLSVFAQADCIAVDPAPAVAVGDEVNVPKIGKYRPGKVTKLDAAVGRVYVEIEFAGQKETIAVAQQDVAPTLDHYGEGFAAPGVPIDDAKPPTDDGKAAKHRSDGDGANAGEWKRPEGDAPAEEPEGKAGKGKAGKNKAH